MTEEKETLEVLGNEPVRKTTGEEKNAAEGLAGDPPGANQRVEEDDPEVGTRRPQDISHSEKPVTPDENDAVREEPSQTSPADAGGDQARLPTNPLATPKLQLGSAPNWYNGYKFASPRCFRDTLRKASS